MTLPGVYSVIVPLPSVVVVVVVVSETCAQAKGAISARAKLSNVVFILLFPCFWFSQGAVTANEILSTPQASPGFVTRSNRTHTVVWFPTGGNFTVLDLVCLVSNCSKPG